MSYLVKAIQSLRPTSEFSLINDDYKTINWIILENNPPTEEELNAEIEIIKANEIIENSNAATAKAALLEKLGITEDEAKLLLS